MGKEEAMYVQQALVRMEEVLLNRQSVRNQGSYRAARAAKRV